MSGNTVVVAQSPSSSDNSGVERIIDTAQASVEDALVAVADLLPKILLALAVIVVAVRIARGIEGYVNRATEYVDSNLVSGVTEEMFPNVRTGTLVNSIVKTFIVLYALFIASRIVGFTELRTELDRILFYLPDLFGGLAIILLSVGVGRLASRRTADGAFVTETEYETEVAIAVKASIIAVGTLVGLEMVGVDLQLVYILAEGFAGAIGIGLTAALAIVIGVIAGTALQDSNLFAEGED